jgi:site-specific DNA recombinase
MSKSKHTHKKGARNMKQAELKRAVAYCRYSSDMQRQESIDAQLRAIYEYAGRNGMTIVHEYIDRAKSATSADRPEFQRMIRDSANKGFEIVIVHKLDRFARNRFDSAHYKHALKRNGVVLRSVVENLDDSPESIVLESVLEGMAEYYSQNLAREVTKGLKENAYKGLHTGGVPPFGYNVDPATKKLIINEHEADGVRLIFKRVLDGVSYDTIINELNGLGYIGKRGQVFSKNGLSSILRNPKYTGDYVFNRSKAKDINGKRSGYKDESEFIIVPDAVPPLVSKADFAAVQEKLKRRMQTRKHSHAKETYYLTGKMFCGVCGGSYVGARRARGDRSAFVAYGCNKRYRSGDCGCNNKEVSKPFIEGWIIERLSEYVFSDKYVPYITQEYNGYIRGRNNDYLTHYEAHKARLKALNKDIDRAVSLLMASSSNALLSKLQELEAQKEQAEYALKELERDNGQQEYSEQDIKAVFANIRDMLKVGTPEAVKAIVEKFISKVEVNPDNIIVHYNFFPEFTMCPDELTEKDCPLAECLPDTPGQPNSAVLSTCRNADERNGERGI